MAIFFNTAPGHGFNPSYTANIANAELTHTASVAAQSILQVPVGRVWCGTVTISCSIAVAASNVNEGIALGVVQFAGQSILRCRAVAGASVASDVQGSQGHNTITVPNVFLAGAPGATALVAWTTITGSGDGEVNYMATGMFIQ